MFLLLLYCWCADVVAGRLTVNNLAVFLLRFHFAVIQTETKVVQCGYTIHMARMTGHFVT